MKKLLTNKTYVVIAVCLGGAVGFFNVFVTLLQKFLCSRGYENWFSGLCGCVRSNIIVLNIFTEKLF